MSVQATSAEGRRLLEACDMHETGLAMLRQRFLREQPQATLGEIEARLRACLIGSVPSVGDIHP